MIDVTEISKRYQMGGGKDVQALDGVSLSLPKGSFTAVVGPSGCGKSTLLMALGALARPTTGSVTVDGKDIYALSGADRARFRATKVGFVFQNFHLVPYLSGRENVLLPQLAGVNGASNGGGLGDPDRAEELLNRFGLGDRADHVPDEMSTGERQRVALARALLNGPEILLADEPTGNLDPDNEKAVLEHICEFHAAGGTVVLVTHNHSLCDLASRTVSLKDGKLVGIEEKASPANS